MTTITIDSDVFAQHIHSLIEVMRMPNTEHVADAHNKAVRFLRAALAAPATAPDELERLRQIAHLTGTIFCYGNFVAETHNEAVLEKLLRENGTFWDSVEQYEKSQGWIP